MTEFAPTESTPVERQQQRAVIDVLRARDQALHLLGTQDDREAPPALRTRQVLIHVPPLQRAQLEEAQRGDLRDDGPDGQRPLLEQIDQVSRDHAHELTHIMRGRSRADLDTDRLLALAVVRLLEIIGEAAARVARGIEALSPFDLCQELLALRS